MTKAYSYYCVSISGNILTIVTKVYDHYSVSISRKNLNMLGHRVHKALWTVSQRPHSFVEELGRGNRMCSRNPWTKTCPTVYRFSRTKPFSVCV